MVFCTGTGWRTVVMPGDLFVVLRGFSLPGSGLGRVPPYVEQRRRKFVFAGFFALSYSGTDQIG